MEKQFFRAFALAGFLILPGCQTNQLPQEYQERIAHLDAQIEEQKAVLESLGTAAQEDIERVEGDIAATLELAQELEKRRLEGEDVLDEQIALQGQLADLLASAEERGRLLSSQTQEAIERIQQLEAQAQNAEQEGLQENVTVIGRTIPATKPWLPFVLPFVPLLGRRGRKHAKDTIENTLKGFNPYNTDTTPFDAIKSVLAYAGISRTHGDNPDKLMADALEELERLGYQLTTDIPDDQIKLKPKTSEKVVK